MRIVIETIPHATHRYPTIGDWWRDPDGTLQIRVSEMDDDRSELLVAVHELVEAILCESRGITEEAVTAFDEAHCGDDDPYVDDPGNSPAAPYHHQHVFAESIERLLAQVLKIEWEDHEAACLALDGKERPRPPSRSQTTKGVAS
jgi:hypothetical protein